MLRRLMIWLYCRLNRGATLAEAEWAKVAETVG